ncbi:MAG: NF038143 family protein, partial [Desulfobacterales bacterium]
LRPPSAWYYLIPGMFLIDFLRRGSTIRKYTETFMFPRKLALESARRLSAGETRAAIDAHLEGEIKRWLVAHRLDSRDLVQAQKETIDLLMDHYVKLFQAEGESYYDFIEHAYASRENFETHLQQIAAAENKVDLAILAKVGDNPAVREKLQLEAQQVENRRRKILEDIF